MKEYKSHSQTPESMPPRAEGSALICDSVVAFSLFKDSKYYIY